MSADTELLRFAVIAVAGLLITATFAIVALDDRRRRGIIARRWWRQ